jgi:phosphoglucomutase
MVYNNRQHINIISKRIVVEGDIMYKSEYESWLKSSLLTAEEKNELENIAKDDKEIEYRFGKELEFGTAGMRGLIGLGTNMINVYTVRRATQALSEYIKSLGQAEMNKGVVISYDTRRMSYEFARDAAIVLVTNGIKAYLFGEVHPVPMLSYAVRELNTAAGIMITASHNPKEYNGYKVYGPDGAQMSPEATAEVVKYIGEIGSCLSDGIKYDISLTKKIKKVSKFLDWKYYKRLLKLALSPDKVREWGKKIKLVYTPVHGSGYIPVTTILKKMGIKATLVEEQLKKDTEFSTVAVPNPEYKETLTLGIKLANEIGADVVFGTDPDCDRLGVAIRDKSGEFVALSGNQVGILLLDYILTRLAEKGELDRQGFVVKSFVSTGMAKKIAKNFGVELMEVPVGFKFIGEKIKQLDDTGKRKFIFGFEESCGYLRGTHCRDKDAVVASMLVAEMVCYYASKRTDICTKLNDLYANYGYYYDTNVSIGYSGLKAMEEMNAVVDKMKARNFSEIGGVSVLAKRDYSTLTRTTLDGEIQSINSSKTNAVYYELENDGFICIRPSGTEPKLKVYYSVSGDNQSQAKELFDNLKDSFEKIMKEDK